MSQFIKAGKAPLLLAGASVGLVSWGNTHHHHAHKDGAAKAGVGTPRAAKQYVLTSPRGIFAISPGPAQCEGSASGHAGGRPIFVSTSRRGDRMAVAAEAEARVKAKGFLRDVISMWETSTESDTHPWVWLDRNPTTPTHVFVGDAPGLLPKIQAAAQRDPNSALVLVRPSRSHSSHSHAKDHAALLHRLGVAVLDGAVERVDPQTGVLLTRDERVILFDSLTVQWGGVRDRAGVEAAAAGLHDEDEDEDDKTQATKAHRPRGEIVRPEGKLVPASASAAAAASAAMQQGGKAGSGSSGAAASGCNRGCSRIVRRKSLHATGEGLHHIVASWRLSRTDTWPWVWLARNEHGPGLHVVVASGREALAAADDRLAECSTSTSTGGCNVLVVGRAGDGVAAAEYDRRGCARIEAEVEELDAAHGIVMLDDERIIEFDSLTFIHSERTGEA